MASSPSSRALADGPVHTNGRSLLHGMYQDVAALINQPWRAATLAKMLGVMTCVGLLPALYRYSGGGNPAFMGGLAQGGMGASLSVDRTVRPEMAEICADRLGVLPGPTMQDLVTNWHERTLPMRPELQALRKKRYFIASLQRDVGPIFGAWQRELLKVIYILGNADLSNIFVSLYESHSSDITQIELIGLDTLLEALSIPHKVVLGHEDLAHPDRASLSRIEFLARLRNIALQPLLESDTVFDTVLYLNDVLFCATDAVDLVRVVDVDAGIDADMSCAVDYIDREPGQDQQDAVRLYDTWVAHDMLGLNMVNDHPYMCHAESQSAFDRKEPFEVFSCWNGMAALDADIFQKHGVRFRSAHSYECQLSECELLGRDMRVLDRGTLVMVPTARTAYLWEVFKIVASPTNPGLPEPVRLRGPPQPEPQDAMCCSIDRRKNIVLLETCLLQRQWRLAYDIFGVPVAATKHALDADMSYVPTGNGVLFPPKGNEAAAGPAAAAAAAMAAAAAEKHWPMPKTEPLIPRRIIEWGSGVEEWADDAQVIMALSSLSYVGANPGYSMEVLSDTTLEEWAAAKDGGAAWEEAVGHAYRNKHIRLGFKKLLYMHANGGVFVPTASWAGQPFDEVLNPLDELVLAVATNHTNNERQLLFVATAPRSPIVAAILERARESVQAPSNVYSHIWKNMNHEGRSMEELEYLFFVGVEMMRDVVMGHAYRPGVRVLQFDQAAVMFDVGRPEHICSGLKERGQLRQMLRARATMHTEAAHKDITPVYFDPEAPFRVIFSGQLQEEQRLGIRRNSVVDVLYTSRQLLQGQYLVPVSENRKSFEPVWTTEPLVECHDESPAGRCFLWLSPEGDLAIYNGLGLADPGSQLVKLVASARSPPARGAPPPPVVTFTWLVLQDDGNLVMYGLTADTKATVALWSADTTFPPDCRPQSACRTYGYVSMLPDGRLALHRGVSPAMRTYLEVGVVAHTRLRECLYHTNFTTVPDFGPPPPANECPLPHLLKLVTFPNSGTSFTLETTMEATKTAVYTCYEAEINGTRENTPAAQELCGKDACHDLGMCQLGRAEPDVRLPPWNKGSLLKTHVIRYRAGIYCGNNGLPAFAEALNWGAFKIEIGHYGFLRLYRNPFDNMVARFHLLAAEGRLPGLGYDKKGFLAADGLFPKRDIYTFLYWHLSMNVLFKEWGFPTALLTYEALYTDPVSFLRSVVGMLGYTEKEVPTEKLMDVSRNVMGRDLLYHEGEAVPVYIDDFYDPDVVEYLANAIHEVLDRTECLTKPLYVEPRVPPIPFGEAPIEANFRPDNALRLEGNGRRRHRRRLAAAPQRQRPPPRRDAPEP